MKKTFEYVGLFVLVFRRRLSWDPPGDLQMLASAMSRKTSCLIAAAFRLLPCRENLHASVCSPRIVMVSSYGKGPAKALRGVLCRAHRVYPCDASPPSPAAQSSSQRRKSRRMHCIRRLSVLQLHKNLAEEFLKTGMLR